jgi:hypothetical protein
MQLQVEQPVLVFEVLLMIQRRLADINCHDFGVRVHERENRRLVSATARNQNVKIGFVFPVRPQNPVRVAGVEPLPVVSELCLEVLYRLGVPVPLVLARDNIIGTATADSLQAKTGRGRRACQKTRHSMMRHNRPRTCAR